MGGYEVLVALWYKKAKHCNKGKEHYLTGLIDLCVCLSLQHACLFSKPVFAAHLC